MTEASIQNLLMKRFETHPHRIANTFIFNWESDFFSMSKDGYAYEVEIKCSYHDFKKDFEKEKHQLLASQDKIFTAPSTRKPEYPHSCQIHIIKPNTINYPNRFFFACPQNLIPLNRIPAYAGLIYATDNHLSIIKPAPLLHKRKLDLRDKLMAKYYWDNINLRQQLKITTQDKEYWKQKANQATTDQL